MSGLVGVNRRLCSRLFSMYTVLVHYIIGASLSEPHTSGTSLRKCVNVRACLLPYTVNFKCAFKYFQKIERPRAPYW